MQWILAYFHIEQLLTGAKVELKTCKSDVVVAEAKMKIVFYCLNVFVYYT